MTSRHARAAIVAACRRMMQAGRLRPPMRACCARAGWSVSTGHRTFGPVAALHRAAIDDVATQHAILRRTPGAERGAPLRRAVWLEASGDLGDELWSIALAATQGSQWMPKPAEFRKLVQGKLDERQRRKECCRAMIDAMRGQGPKPFQRDAFRWVGNIAKAALYGRQVAGIETHAPEPWAIDAPANGSAP